MGGCQSKKDSVAGSVIVLNIDALTHSFEQSIFISTKNSFISNKVIIAPRKIASLQEHKR